jgi:hypothetical protein
MGEAAILLIASVLTAGVAIHAMVAMMKAAKANKLQSKGDQNSTARTSEPTGPTAAPY